MKRSANMFIPPCFRRKKNQNTTEKVVENKSRPRSTSSGRVAVSDAPAAKTSTENRKGRTLWWYRLFGSTVNKKRSPKEPVGDGQRAGPLQSKVASSHGPATITTTAGSLKTGKSRWRCRVFDCCGRKRRVAPAADDEGRQRTPRTLHGSPVTATDRTPCAADEVDEVVEFKAPTDDEEEAAEKGAKKKKRDKLPILMALVMQTVCNTLAKQGSSCKSAVTQAIGSQSLGGQQDWLGFPNPAQMCYMNSSLQSLITLADFIRDVSSQEDVWSSLPEAELMRRFMDVVWSHRSVDSCHKLQALDMFKRALSVQAPEFRDNYQKDAHEFLMTVLDQMRSLSPLLQEVAASFGKSYRCPVEDHLVFKMQNTRTCKGCGARFTQVENFTIMSLNLVPGDSVQELLQDSLMETDLDFRCDCGANTSSQQSTFATLPKVLILHLKRFRFTPLLQLEKLSDPVDLFRELMVTSSQADGWYSLVSVISHLGAEGNRGHYVSNGVHPDAELDDPDDRWLNYNDSNVTETTGASVCSLRQQTSYILFYQRRM